MSERKTLKMAATVELGLVDESVQTAEASAGSSVAVMLPDPEVGAAAKRRQFSAAYKLAVRAEADRLTEPGALLRRKGLYSSHPSVWWSKREADAVEALDRRRGFHSRRGSRMFRGGARSRTNITGRAAPTEGAAR